MKSGVMSLSLSGRSSHSPSESKWKTGFGKLSARIRRTVLTKPLPPQDSGCVDAFVHRASHAKYRLVKTDQGLTGPLPSELSDRL